MNKDFGEKVCELDSRSGNGVDVALLWEQRDNRAIVAVVDHESGEAFVLDVHENDDAIDMFHHPYAYAAHRGIDQRQHCRIAA
jgi:hypothetical protein